MLLVLAAAVTLDRVAIVGHVDDGPWTDAPTEARIDQKAELAVVAIGHRGKQRVVLAPAGVREVRIAGKRSKVERLDDTLEVRWSIVEPHGFRTSRAENGATSEFYSNVSTEPKTFGHWLGYDKVDYFETVVHERGHDYVIPAEVRA